MKNPFRYRSYYYDFETNLYYLNSRYYDPETGRFVNADDIAILNSTKEVLNGLNLYTYCLNNPVNYIDPDGQFVLALIFAFLAVTTIAGAIIGGVISHNNGNTGWDLAKDIILGAGLGLAAGGAIVAAVAAIAGALGVTAVLGASIAQIFAIGALAFDFTAFVIAPLFGFDMQGIEFETNNSNNDYYKDNFPSYNTPSHISNDLKINKNNLIVFRRNRNGRISWRFIWRLQKIYR